MCVNAALRGGAPLPKQGAGRSAAHGALSFRHQPKVSAGPYGETPSLQLTSAPPAQCTIILPPHMSIHLLGSCHAAYQIGFSESTNTEAVGSSLVPTPAFIPA